MDAHSTRASLWIFVLAAYGISWVWLLPMVIGHDLVRTGVGWPTHLPALAGPMLAALLAAGLTGRLGPLTGSMVRVRVPLRWWLVALSPLAMLAAGLLGAFVSGAGWPRWPAFGEMPGLPAGLGVIPVAVLLILAGFGEETGWRGWLLPALQRGRGPLYAMTVVAVVWAGWHAPLFLVLASFAGFGPVTLVGWFLGLLAGSFVLGWLYNRTGSVALCAVWHGLFNVVSGTAAATDAIAATVSAIVMVLAVALVIADRVAHARGRSSPLAPSSAALAPATAV